MGNDLGPMWLWAIRHGQSTANLAFDHAMTHDGEEPDLGCRDVDVPLSALGEAQADAVGGWLARLSAAQRPEAIYCSPYLRAWQTLRIALRRLSLEDQGGPLPVRIDERLRDQELGILELLTARGIDRRFAAEAARRRQVGEVYYRPPGGESLLDVALRVRSFLRDLDHRPEQRVLLVCHDTPVLMLRDILDEASETELDELMTRNPVRNASVSHWQRSNGEWQRIFYNDTTHVAGVENE